MTATWLLDRIRAVPLVTWGTGLLAGILAWGLLESLPENPISRPVSAGFAMCVVVGGVLGVGWWHNTLVTDEHEEQLGEAFGLISELADLVEDLVEAVNGLRAEETPDAVNDGLTVEAPPAADVDTDLETAADDSLEPAAALPDDPAVHTARMERIDLAGGLRVPPEDQQPAPEPVVDEVDLALARFGLRTSEGRRTG